MYSDNDKEIAQSYVDAGMCDTLQEALNMLDDDGLLDWQQSFWGWDKIEAGEEQ